MARYRVTVGRPDGKHGDIIEIEAINEERAQSIALVQAHHEHPTWVVLGVEPVNR